MVMHLPPPHHRLTVDLNLGGLHLQADVPLEAPWTVLFGPSGSGKSTLLRAACGLLGCDGVRFVRQPALRDEQALITPAHSSRPQELGLGYAPQQSALFPHLNVEQNIAFPRTARGERLPESELDGLLQMFEIVPLRARSPRQLSGGERQRVNLARALAVPHAHLLLLDEPFAGLGRELRDRLIGRLQGWTHRRSLPVFSVTHDVDEALLLGADVVVLEDGKVVRRGPAAQALAAERERLLRVLG